MVVSCPEVVTEVDDSDEVGTDVSSDIGYIQRELHFREFSTRGTILFVSCYVTHHNDKIKFLSLVCSLTQSVS